jgi:hypothetical protein
MVRRPSTGKHLEFVLERCVMSRTGWSLAGWLLFLGVILVAPQWYTVNVVDPAVARG